jgi:cytochrome c-type biogenesis protein CcmH/NrfG
MAKQQNPNNPAPYFFLGEGFLKQGNLKECLRNVSKAIALRTDMNANQSTQAEPVATSSSGIQSKDKVDATHVAKRRQIRVKRNQQRRS